MGQLPEPDGRDRDRAILTLRWLTAAGGIASVAVAGLGTAVAAEASTPSAPTVRATTPGLPKPSAGALTASQLGALNFSLPKPQTVVIWRVAPATMGGSYSGQAPARGQAPAAGPAPAAGSPAQAAPPPPPPPPPVATTGTS
jgi:hypothetical protein